MAQSCRLFPLMALLFAGMNAQQTGELLVQDGTPVKLSLDKPLSSAIAELGQQVPLEVAGDIDVDGITVLRKGTLVTGEITAAESKKTRGRAGRVSFSIDHVTLADGERANLRAFNDTSGESHKLGMAGLMLNMPTASAPFFLFLKGRDTVIPQGTVITAFINGDLHLDMARFAVGPNPLP